jgi:hypothetical protein
VTFLFHDHWAGGAAAAEHWYRRAVGLTADAIDGVLRAHGIALDVPRAHEQANLELGGRPLLRIGEQLVAVDRQGEPLLAEGEDISFSPDDRARMREAAASGRCACQLCDA